MEYIVACHAPLLEALRAFADHLASLPDPRDPRGVRHPLPVLLGTLRWPPPRTTTMPAALLLRDGTSLPDLRQLILALDGKVARRSGDRASGMRALHMVSPS